MSSDLYLPLEVSAGSHIARAAEEAIAVANRLSLQVRFMFNDVLCYVEPDGSAEALINSYHKAIEFGMFRAWST